MSDNFEKYIHHKNLVSVRKELKGKHKEFCLCYSCEKFISEHRESNCDIANMIFALCVACDVVTPVWECPKFIKKENNE